MAAVACKAGSWEGDGCASLGVDLGRLTYHLLLTLPGGSLQLFHTVIVFSFVCSHQGVPNPCQISKSPLETIKCVHQVDKGIHKSAA